MPGKADWVTIAALGKTHANRGEITAVNLSASPNRFENLRKAWLFRDSAEPLEVAIESVWEHGARLVFKFQGIDDISAAEVWQGSELRVPASERAPLEPGAFYYSDLIGCHVYDRKSGDNLGRVRDVREFGGPGVLELDSGIMIPYAKAICVNIDVAAKRIDADLPEGLRDINS